MKNLFKILGILMLIGLIMSVVGFFMGMNLDSLGSVFNDDASYGEMITYTLDEQIDTLEMTMDKRHITYIVTDETVVTVTYYEKEDDSWSFDYEDLTLTIIQKEPIVLLNWFSYKHVSKEKLTVRVYIPESWVTHLDLSTHVGEIRLDFEETQTFENVALTSNTGSIVLKNAIMDTVSLDIDTGSMTLSDLTVIEDFDAHTATGNLSINNISARDLDVSSSTGRITLTHIVAHTLKGRMRTGSFHGTGIQLVGEADIRTSTGDIVISNILAEDIYVKAGTGDVRLTFSDLSDYSFNLSTGTGTVYVDGNNQSRSYIGGSGSVSVRAEVNTGSIRIIRGD